MSELYLFYGKDCFLHYTTTNATVAVLQRRNVDVNRTVYTILSYKEPG
jgi:hypothetical protein